jgi:hypothetical protein
MAYIRRYVVLTPAQVTALALWVVHTHCARIAEQTPYLAVTSPEKQCGKSRLLEVLELLCARPWNAILPTEAVLFRKVNDHFPTLLFDEVDKIFSPRSADRYEAHQALLNAGHRRGAKVPRCVGNTGKVIEFSVYCPKALAGIGTLPETITDRSIPIRLARRKRDEPVERFFRRSAEPDAAALRDRIIEWLGVDGRLDALQSARPDLPEQLSDRMQEGCEPLLAIADAAGVGEEARAALIELLTGERLDDAETIRLKLLRGTQIVFELARMPHGIATTDLLAGLREIPESPWLSYYGRTFEDRDLASLLRHYGIRSTTIRPRVRIRADRAKKVFRGYKRDDLAEAWERYL